MRMPVTWSALALSLLFTAFGCSSAKTGVEPDDAGDGASGPQDGGACNLRRSGLAFATPSCEVCMQTSCCEATVACFSGNQDCVDLRTCLIACPDEQVGAILPIGDAGGGGGGGGMTTSCRDACANAHPAAVPLESAYDTCVKTTCAAGCN